MWLSHYWEIYLQELLRLEGRGDFVDTCAECNINSPFYHCRDCFGGWMLCQECTVLGHTLAPLHCLEYWNGTFFQKTSLKSFGLCIQLGHLPGEICGNPKRAFNDDFTVIDSHGIHTVAVDYCDCKSVKSLVQQLLRVSWFLATTANPHSVITFCLLQEFQLLSFELKVSAYEFYQSLAHNSDDNGISDIKVSSIYFSHWYLMKSQLHRTIMSPSSIPSVNGVTSGCSNRAVMVMIWLES
ncbi:hypothetical protein EDC04DRAFT_2571614 [Pisolithus marmoratus]|nr:hypothetical protein EDC04DRAFT_2571614 [Pisolithus marmoratus]